MSMEPYETLRGFRGYKFIDHNGCECSVQESSLVEPHLWVGMDKPNRQNMRPGMGDAEYKIICDANSRMHLDVPHVTALRDVLDKWLAEQKV